MTPLGEAEVLRLLSEAESLPALPTVVHAVTRRITNPRTSAAEVGRLLAHDQALTARVLRLANSAFYALREPVKNPEHAVVLMGFSTVRAIILKASIFSAFDLASAKPFWLHALGAACSASAIARVSGLGRPEDAFVMGLLHDLGKLALMRFLPEQHALIRAEVEREGGLVRDAERRVLGCDHAVVGRFLCEHWSLPADYRMAIAAHHDLDRSDDDHRPWAALVQLADVMARSLLIGNGGDHAVPVLDPRTLDLLHLNEDRFDDLFTAAEEEIGRAEVFFTILNG